MFIQSGMHDVDQVTDHGAVAVEQPAGAGVAVKKSSKKGKAVIDLGKIIPARP